MSRTKKGILINLALIVLVVACMGMTYAWQQDVENIPMQAEAATIFIGLSQAEDVALNLTELFTNATSAPYTRAFTLRNDSTVPVRLSLMLESAPNDAIAEELLAKLDYEFLYEGAPVNPTMEWGTQMKEIPLTLSIQGLKEGERLPSPEQLTQVSAQFMLVAQAVQIDATV